MSIFRMPILVSWEPWFEVKFLGKFRIIKGVDIKSLKNLPDDKKKKGVHFGDIQKNQEHSRRVVPDFARETISAIIHLNRVFFSASRAGRIPFFEKESSCS